MSDNNQTQALDKDKILSTQSRRILFDCLLKGMSIEDAAPQAKISPKYARKWVAKGNVNALVKQETAKISEKVGITVEWAQNRLVEEIEAATAEGKRSAAIQGLATLLKSIGGMTGDRPHPDSQKGKRDDKRDELLRAIADEFIARKYLARPISDTHRPMSAQNEVVKHIESTCKDGTELVNTLDLRPLAGPTGDERQDIGQTGCKQAVEAGQGIGSPDVHSSIAGGLQAIKQGYTGDNSEVAPPYAPKSAGA